MWDVIVAGAGPGGSSAAKACARHGLKTLILEKKRLPRDKVCSGLVAGPMARDIIQQEFGQIPQQVLVPPYKLSGQVFHVPEVEPKTLEWDTLLAWRKDLDSWFNKKAQEEGVEIWDGVKVTDVRQFHGQCKLGLARGKIREELKANFVIGADGAGSAVRKSLFPELKVQYSVPIRECYKGSLDLDKDYLHWFFPRASPRPRFSVNHKGDFFLIEGSGVKELRGEIIKILIHYGLNPVSEPLWRDACLIPRLHDGLISGSFSPARGNVLLIGDAAGLLFPITFEGIGVALKSGLLAAAAVSKAYKEGRQAAEIYLGELRPIIESLKILHILGKELEKEQTQGGWELSGALKAAYAATLKIV